MYRIVYSTPPKYFIDGNEVTEETFNASCPKKSVSGLLKEVPNALMETSKAWPIISDAWGVGKKQKKQAEETMAKLGVPTEYVSDGHGGYSAVVRNNQHKRELMKATRTHNTQGGYGTITG